MTASRQPWKRTVWAKSPAGYGVEVPAPKAAMTPALYGRQCERAAAKLLFKEGYVTTRSHLSRGRADVVAVGPDVRQIQVKSCQVFSGSFMNEGIREIAQLPASARRECWGFVKGRGHVVTVELLADGALTVTGQKRYADEVRAAIGRMRKGLT